ncbi:MAG: glycosyltransferase [Rhodanobacter sp.]
MAQKPGVSICMIVKNEAELLRRALHDWEDLGDELLIVDTGSTDNTVFVAESIGGRVLAYDWQYPGNKGAARNLAIDQAGYAWIVMLDADEVIRTPAALRAAIMAAPGQVTGLNTIFENIADDGSVTLRWRQLRTFRRDAYAYRHREHELPFAVDLNCKECDSDVVFEHRPPAGRDPGKIQPMLDRLTLDVEEHPDDPHPLYFLHRQYLHAGQNEQAIETGIRYLQLPGTHDRCEAIGNIALAYDRLGQLHMSIVWLHNALGAQPGRRVWWLRLAEVYYNHGYPQQALPFLHGARAVTPAPGEQHEQPGINDLSIAEFIHLCEHATGVAHVH